MSMTDFNKKNWALATLMILLLFLDTGEAQSNQDCCLSYIKKRLPPRAITSFSEQLSSEVCDISAIIFHTRNGLRACADPKEHWVKKLLHSLKEKLKKAKQ